MQRLIMRQMNVSGYILYVGGKVEGWSKRSFWEPWMEMTKDVDQGESGHKDHNGNHGWR